MLCSLSKVLYSPSTCPHIAPSQRPPNLCVLVFALSAFASSLCDSRCHPLWSRELSTFGSFPLISYPSTCSAPRPGPGFGSALEIWIPLLPVLTAPAIRPAFLNFSCFDSSLSLLVYFPHQLPNKHTSVLTQLCRLGTRVVKVSRHRL